MQRIVFAALIALSTQTVSNQAAGQPQQEIVTPAFVLPGCRTLVENDPNGNMMQMGACAGAVSAVFNLGKDQRHICPPAEADMIEAARVIMGHFNRDPALQSGHFGTVAWRALGERWGCRR